MTAISRSALVTLLGNKVITGNNATTAQNIRDFENNVIDSFVNSTDDADIANGYMKISAGGIVNESFIKKITPTGDFLRDDGTWQPVGSTGTPNLQQVLTTGSVLSSPATIYGNVDIEIAKTDITNFSNSIIFNSSGAVLGAYDILNGISNILTLTPTNATLSKNITALSFTKSGGASSQFLKADGSVDSSTYLTSASLTGYVPYTGATTDLNMGAFSVTTPLIVGGSAVGSNVIYKSTTGVGTTSGIAHSFVGGNNGATTIANFYNNGNAQFNVGTVTNGYQIRDLFGTPSFLGIYVGVTPSATNYIMAAQGSGSGDTYLNTTSSSGNLDFRIGGAQRMYMTNNSVAYSPTGFTSGSTSSFSYVQLTRTGITASTECFGMIMNFTGSKTWATGNLSLQREVVITAPTYAAVGASIFTEAATVGITGAPIKSTNVSLTSTYALLINSVNVGAATTSYGVFANAMTGAGTNYAGGFNGNVNVIGALYSTGFRLIDGNQGLNKVLISDANGNASWATSSTGYAKSVNNIAVNTTGAAVANTDYLYFCTATLTFTLPTAVGNTNTYYIKVTSGTLTINTTSSQTIDGSLTITTSVANTAYTVISNGTNWQIL